MLSRPRARFAAELFLASLRRQFVAAYPERSEECPVKRLDDYKPEHQVMLMKACQAAIASAEQGSDKKFETWHASQMEAARE